MKVEKGRFARVKIRENEDFGNINLVISLSIIMLEKNYNKHRLYQNQYKI